MVKPHSGIELIWQLEDCYNEKNVSNFLSLLSSAFKKDFISLQRILVQEFRTYIKLKISIYIRSKSFHASTSTHEYKTCWVKRCTKPGSDRQQRRCGSATLIFQDHGHGLLLEDIQGENPFFTVAGLSRKGVGRLTVGIGAS